MLLLPLAGARPPPPAAVPHPLDLPPSPEFLRRWASSTAACPAEPLLPRGEVELPPRRHRGAWKHARRNLLEESFGRAAPERETAAFPHRPRPSSRAPARTCQTPARHGRTDACRPLPRSGGGCGPPFLRRRRSVVLGLAHARRRLRVCLRVRRRREELLQVPLVLLRLPRRVERLLRLEEAPAIGGQQRAAARQTISRRPARRGGRGRRRGARPETLQ